MSENSSVGQKHPYHLVDPSPLPFLSSIAGLAMAAGLVFYMHYDTKWLLILGTIGLLTVMFLWWRDVIKESTFQQVHTPVVELGLRYGMALFIASEVMFFFAFFWAYFNASVPFLSFVASPVWPPEGIVPLPTWELPFLNTMILLTSGATLTVAHHAVRAGDRQKLIRWLAITVALGFLFLGTQIYEYGHAAFKTTDGI